MKTILTSFFSLLVMYSFAQVDVTFQVDMSNETVSGNGVHIAGSLNGWNTSVDLLTDPDGDNIYTITLNLSSDSDFEYKYLNGDAWGTEEIPPMACAIGGNNRIFTSGVSPMTLPIVPFSGCPSPNPTQQVTFTVDMSMETVSPNGVHIAGNFNGWNPGAMAMTLIGNDFYQVTATVLSSITTVQYKFINGNNWGSEESIPAACSNTSTNRNFIIEGAGSNIELPAYEFGTCNEVSIILPIVLESFKASSYDKGVILNWVTSLEINNEGFEIQHSRNGTDWRALSFVRGSGSTSKMQDYTFKHHLPESGINYYRLKQIDFDGQFEYSDIASISYQSDMAAPSVYPNPVVNYLMIDNAIGDAILYDIFGKSLKRIKISDQSFRMDTSDLQPGNYFLILNREDGTTYDFNIFK